MKCKDCKYWDRWSGLDKGICERPPSKLAILSVLDGGGIEVPSEDAGPVAILRTKANFGCVLFKRKA